MTRHVTHFYWESGWPDDYAAGCHLETYEKHSSKWAGVTCKHCLRNKKKWEAANERAEAEIVAPQFLEKDNGKTIQGIYL